MRPVPFAEEISHPDYVEYWSDELQIFHNPNAKRPLDEHVFGGITQHYFRDGQQYSITPEGVVLTSQTIIIGVDKELGERGGA